jgi:hypothetical protein
MGRGSLNTRQSVFGIGNRSRYAAMNKSNRTRMKQGVLNGLAGGEF